MFEIFPVLRERADETAASLSGGEQQMLSLAQAFLAKPRLLLIDELSLGLSPAVVGQLLEIVREIHGRGITIIVVEQSVNVALTLAEKAIFMEKGEVRFFGETADLLGRPDILRAVYVKGTGAADRRHRSALRSERERRALELGEARTVLEVEGLAKRFGGITAVDDVSFALREGEVLGLIGPNGSGKTTMFDLISGYQRPTPASVRFDGVDITDLAPEERARRKLVRRFQDARLFPSLTVFETLLVALEQRLEVKSALLSAAQLPQARRAERRVRLRAERLVELLELGAYRDKFVRELSTGLRRIVDLACVLAAEPQVLLLDEPSLRHRPGRGRGPGAAAAAGAVRDRLQDPDHRARHAAHLRRVRRADRPRPGAVRAPGPAGRGAQRRAGDRVVSGHVRGSRPSFREHRMTRRRASSLLALVAILGSAACGSDNKVGDKAC